MVEKSCAEFGRPSKPRRAEFGGPPPPDRKIMRKRYPFSYGKRKRFSFSLCSIGAKGAAAEALWLTNELLKIQHNRNYVELTRKSLILLRCIFDAWQKTRKIGLFCPFFRFCLWDVGPNRPPDCFDQRPHQCRAIAPAGESCPHPSMIFAARASPTGFRRPPGWSDHKPTGPRGFRGCFTSFQKIAKNKTPYIHAMLGTFTYIQLPRIGFYKTRFSETR